MAKGQNIVSEASRLIFQPLQTVFNVYEDGGQFGQTKDTVTGEFIPDRTKAPLVLRPYLYVKDPSKFIEDGEKTNEMSVTWKYDGAVVTSTDSSLEENIYVSGKNLVIKKNLSKLIEKVEFVGTYTDKRRGNVLKFQKTWDLTLRSATQQAISMSIDQPKVVRLSPFSPYDLVVVNCQLMEGPNPIADSLCQYTWQYKNDSGVWKDISNTTTAQTLFVQSVQEKKITLIQQHIQSVELRCVGIVLALKDNNAYTQYQYVRLYRYYGDVQKPYVLPKQGAILTLDTKKVTNEVALKYSGGDIPTDDVLKNFSIYWYYKYGLKTTTWTQLPDYDTMEASVVVDPINMKDGNGNYYDSVVLGAEVFPLTALLPVKAAGKALSYDGKFITAQTEITE